MDWIISCPVSVSLFTQSEDPEPAQNADNHYMSTSGQVPCTVPHYQVQEKRQSTKTSKALKAFDLEGSLKSCRYKAHLLNCHFCDLQI